MSVSDLLAEHGVTFDGNRALFLAYERAVRREGTGSL